MISDPIGSRGSTLEIPRQFASMNDHVRAQNEIKGKTEVGTCANCAIPRAHYGIGAP